MTIYRPTPRVVSAYALGTTFAQGTTNFPVRARDDLDPCQPPLEYADGRISWDGYGTREARDEARHRRAIEREGELAAAATARAEAEERMAQAIERRRIATLRSAIASCPGHRAAHTSTAWGFVGPVSREENRAAHGAVGYTYTCSCGAQRQQLVNGPHVETGAWGDPIG